MLEVGMKAPDFTLQDKDGKSVSLSDFLGKKVVLYFYPKDNTPGCTRQACAFAGAYAEFQNKGVEVIGISRDSVASHVKFAEKHGLPFVLLSDPDLTAIQAYGVWQEKKLYGKVSMGVVRTTFVIDEEGKIERVMPKVKPDTNAAEILAALYAEQRGEQAEKPSEDITPDELIGKVMLVGITYYAEGKPEPLEQQQFWGTVTQVNKNLIRIKRPNGETLTLPPDLRSTERARPGEYTLRSTGEIVTNPDFLARWNVTRPAEGHES